MTVTLYSYGALPVWVNKACLSSNGHGKEMAQYLVIEDGGYQAVYSTAMEPGDALFTRDLSWIKHELDRIASRRVSPAAGPQRVLNHTINLNFENMAINCHLACGHVFIDKRDDCATNKLTWATCPVCQPGGAGSPPVGPSPLTGVH